MRELFGHRVELPTSPCVAGNTSGVKRRRRDGARASEGTASRPRDAAGSGLGRLFICWHECQLGLSDDLPSKLSQLTKPAHPRVPQSDRRMQRLGGGAAAVVRQESSPRRLCAQHHACGARQLDPVMGNRRNTTGTPRVRVALSEMRRPRAGLQRPRRSRLPTIRTSPGDGLGHRHLGAAQGRRFVPLATKLDIPTANGVSIAIGLSGGDSGGWRLGPLGRGGRRAEPAQPEAPRTPTGRALPSTSVTPNHPTALHRGGVYPIPSTSDETTEGPTASPG